VRGDEYGALLRYLYEFYGSAAAGSDKSGDPILYREHPHIQNRSDATGDFKNSKSDAATVMESEGENDV
jgi:hypothetical protein